MNAPRDLFDEGFIRLSQLTVLNDPFEAYFCRASLDKLTKHFDDSTAFDVEFGELSFVKYIELRMHNIGVISFTENKENLLMWAHYANEHKGVVAGVSYNPHMGIFHDLFRADYLLNTAFHEEWSQFDGSPKPVLYRKGLRYRHDKFDYDYSNISAEGADRILYEIFMQKSDEWIYEQEHRVVLRLEQADRVIGPNIEDIDNSTIKDKLKKSSYALIDPKTGAYVVDLLNIEDDSERIAVARALAKLSHNPETVFLMKLSSGCINNCLLGLKSEINKEDIEGGYACSTGYLDIWKAKKNVDYYNLEFKQI